MADRTEQEKSILDQDTGEIDYLPEAWESMEDKPPTYTISPVPKQRNVDPGDNIEIDMFINGCGKITQNKLQISYPFSDFVVDSEKKGEIRYGIWTPENQEKHKLFSTEIRPGECDLKKLDATIPLVPEMFSPINDDDHLYPILTSEVAFADTPFLSITLQTSEDVSPGDYPIFFTFTYGNEDETHQDQKRLLIHINNAREQREPWVTRAALAIVLIVLLSLIIQAVDVIARSLNTLGF